MAAICLPLSCTTEFCKRLAFDEFAKAKLAERVHEALVKDNLGEELIGHVSRDGTAIHGRERPAKQEKKAKASKPAPRKRGRPRKGEVRPAAKEPPVARQRKQTLREMLAEIPRQCDCGAKKDAQGFKISWNGYKLHLDTADCGVPISALISSASMHDSLAALPLSRITTERVTHCYDLMDAAYCSAEIRADSREQGHVPLIDHNPRGGTKIEFAPAETIRYNERTVAERMNARLKEEFGGNNVMVRGADKVMNHLMFGVLVLSADQLMRLRQ